jgi:hypothetical protein
MEHIGRYLVQLGEASVEEAHKVWFFPLSLYGPTFSWFYHSNQIQLLDGPI